MDEGPRGWGTPLYERVADRAAIDRGTAVLDVGCGTGAFCRLAADRGARVAGIDADPRAVADARALVPEADLRVGDMRALPYPDDVFDVVTGFQSFFSATSPLTALREAGRVARAGATVAMTVWGREEHCDIHAAVTALAPLLPPRRAVERVPLLGAEGRLERLAERAGLTPREAGEVTCPFLYPDDDALVNSVLASAPGQLAARRGGAGAVRRLVLDGLASYRTTSGGYRLDNTFRYLLAAV